MRKSWFWMHEVSRKVFTRWNRHVLQVWKRLPRTNLCRSFGFPCIILKKSASLWFYCLTLGPKEGGSTKLEWDSDTQLIFIQIKKVMGWGGLATCNPSKEGISGKLKEKRYLGFLKGDDVQSIFINVKSFSKMNGILIILALASLTDFSHHFRF